MQDITHPRLISTSRYRRRNDGPGPGSYDPPLTPLGPKVSIGVRWSQRKSLMDNPAPGTYNHDLKPTTPGYTFGGRSAGPIITEEVPGPGQYKLDNGIIGGHSFFINSIARFKVHKQVIQPGPGAYEVHHRVSHGPHYSVSCRHNDPKDRERTPGPGQYKPRFVLQSPTVPNVTFTSSERPSPCLTFGPGPGTYFETESYAASTSSSSMGYLNIGSKRNVYTHSTGIIPMSPTSSYGTTQSSVRSSGSSLPILRYLSIDETDVPDLKVYNYNTKITSSSNLLNPPLSAEIQDRPLTSESITNMPGACAASSPLYSGGSESEVSTASEVGKFNDIRQRKNKKSRKTTTTTTTKPLKSRILASNG